MEETLNIKYIVFYKDSPIRVFENYENMNYFLCPDLDFRKVYRYSVMVKMYVNDEPITCESKTILTNSPTLI